MGMKNSLDKNTMENAAANVAAPNRELPQHSDDANRRSTERKQVHNGNRIQLH